MLDVLFVLKATVGTTNTSCTNQSKELSGSYGPDTVRLMPWGTAGADAASFAAIPCVFMVAVAGTNGHTLWERPLVPPFHWAQCGLQGLGGTDSGCLVAHAHLLTAVNKNTGKREVYITMIRRMFEGS